MGCDAASPVAGVRIELNSWTAAGVTELLVGARKPPPVHTRAGPNPSSIEHSAKPIAETRTVHRGKSLFEMQPNKPQICRPKAWGLGTFKDQGSAGKLNGIC